jgi:transposase
LISFLELALRMNVANVASPSARDRLVGERTVLINQLRGILLERGIAFPQRRRKLGQYLAELLASGGGVSLSQRTLTLIEDMRVQRRDLDVRIEAFDAEFVACARQGDDARRLATIPGIGVMNATAFIAAIGDGRSFSRGRDLAAWLGLVPRLMTTGGKIRRLVGITKRGNKYLRKLLIHGARAAMSPLASSNTRLGEWLRSLLTRAHRNTASWRLSTSWRG